MTKTLPDLLTWSRIVLSPVIAVAYFLGDWGAFVATILFIIAAVTDYADGKIAREYTGTNKFGAFLDPIADKILVTIVLLTLVVDPDLPVDKHVLGTLAALIIVRELVQSALRDWMAQSGKSTEVAVTGLSKTKTAVQLVGLGLMLGYSPLLWLSGDNLLLITGTAWALWIGVTLLVIAAALGLMSLWKFLRIAFSRNSAGASSKVKQQGGRVAHDKQKSAGKGVA